VAIGVGWLFAFSPILGARDVDVRGNRTITVQQVREAARVPHGRPLLRLNTAAIRERVAAMPEIATVDITVSYPSTVRITVSERIAVGYLENDGGLVLVDKTGTQFRHVRTPPNGLPRFDVPSGTTAQLVGAAVANVAGALPLSVVSKLAAISATDATSITLQLQDGRVVRWGTRDRNADKVRILPTLLRQRGTLFDLSNPDEAFSR
jgi:cell division protein FtsQ